jgi:peptidoglycan/LPS O-acetylase OafA/YrhL
MRALAVLLVVAFHAGLGPVQGGFVGVDVFFVISGFLITGLLVDEVGRTGSIDLPAFWARRMRRLLPMATAVLVTTVVVFRFVLAPLDREGLGDSVVASALWTANWHFAAAETDYMSDAAHSPVLHYWSLSVEEQFYLLWPLLILFVLWLSRRLGVPGASGVPGPVGSRAWTVLCRGEGRAPLRWFAAALVGLGGVSLLLSLLLTRSSGPWAYYGLHTRAWELSAGAGLALARPLADLLPRAWAVVSGWSGLALICLSALLIDRSTAFPGGTAIWPVLGACLLITAGARSRSGASYVLSRPLPMFLGRISYGWYLWHWPCLQLVHHLAAPAPQEDELMARGGTGFWPVLLAVIGSLFLAVLTHQVIELPVRRWTWLVAFPRRALVAGACLLLVATSVPSLLLVSTTSPSTAAVGETGAGTGEGTGSRPSAAGGNESSRAGGTSSGAVVLRASPEQARNDQQAPNRCFVSFDVSTADSRCRFGDPTALRTMVLFGDSHAAHWFPALEEIARREKWQLMVWAKSGCGYADTAQWLSNFRREYTECATWREAALQQIEALPRVDAVVVARSMHQLGKLLDEDGRLSTDEELRRRLWAEGADRTLRRLRARAGAVVLVRDSPRPPHDIPACISEHPSDPGRCDFPFEGNADRDGQVFRAELEAIRANGIQVMGTSDLVCEGDRCPAVSRHGNITYRDNHHLTGTFARELSTVFGRRLLPLIERRS